MDLSPLSLSFDQHARGQASWSHPASVAARAAALIAGLLGFGSASAHAQVYSEWTGGPLWSDGANWSSGNVTNYGQLEFKGNGTATMDNDLGAALGQWRMYFNGAQSYTLGSSTGQVINLFDNSGQHSWLLSDSSVTQTIGSTQTINFAATSGDTFGQISARGAGDLVLGPIGITGSQVAQLRVAGTSTGKIIFNNVISGTSKQVVIGLDESAVDQANTIAIYKGTNTYDGDTFIVAGQLQVESGNLTSGGTVRLGQTSGSNVATLSLADLDGGLTVARDLVVRAGSSGTKTLTSLNTSGINTHSGGLFLDANLSLVNTAGGTLALTGTALDLKTFTLNASGGGATTISNVISNTGGSGFIVKSGSGSLALSGVNTFTGGVTVNGGTVIASNALALGGAATSTINATGTLQVTGGIVLSNTSLVALNDGGTINSNGTNTVEGKISVGNTGSPSVTVSTTGSGDILTLGNGGNDLSGGTATATINVSGPGTVLASQVSDYLGKWSLTSGVLQLGATAAMGTGTTAVTLNGGSLAGRLAAGTVFTGPAAAGLLVTANSGLISDRSTANAGVTHTFGPLSIGGQTLTTSVGSNVTSGVGGITVGAVTLTGAPTFSTNLNALLTMGAITGTNQNLNFAGAGNTTVTGIIGTGTGSITKTGTGTLTLGGVNTFTGGINANGGLIAFAGVDTALGSVVPINFNGGGISQTAATYTPPAARTFILGAGGGTLDVVIAGSAGKILLNTANTITGTGPLTKTGAGTLQLTQPNNFVGNVAINGGFVEMQNVSGLGSNTVSVNAGGELVASNNNLANPITLNGGVLSANGALLAGTFSGPINVTANSTIGARTFQAQANTNTITLSGALTGSGNLALTTGATVVAASPANVILRSDVSGYSGTMSIGSGVTLLPRALTNMTVGSAGSPGINATYYNFASNVGIASSNFSTTQLFNRPQSFTRTDALISVAQAGGSGEYPTVPVPHFGVTAVGGAFNAIMWKGLLNITSAGTYQFSGTDDDNATLFIDGVNIGSLGVIAANTNIGAGVFLSAGAHSIVYRHTNGTGGGYATLSYNGGAGSDTGANTVLVGSVANSLSTGSLAATVIPALNITGLVATPSVMDIQADNSAASLSFAAGTQFNLTSPTNSNLLITGASTLTGAAVLNNTGASVTYAGAIGETSAGSTFTQGVAGSLAYITNFQGINTYTGLTSVLAGQLNLNATGGNSVSTGGLTVNATNVTAFVNNVQLLQSNQIADTAPVTVTSGILNMGAFNDSVGTLTLNGGQLLGSGTITPTTGVFQSGVLGAGLGGSGGLSKTTTGTLIVSGPSSFTGATAITAGALTAQSNTALGATGGGNGTSVTAGAALQLQGSITSAEEITLNGSGIATTGSLRNLGGLNTLSSTVLLATASTIQSDGGSLTLSNGTNSVTGTDVNLTLQGMGDIVLNSPWSLGTGTVTKAGNGALIFNQNLTSIPAMTWNGGILGFNGTQTLGSVTIGTTAPTAATTWRVNSDPGAGTTITIPTATALIAGYAADQTLLSRISTGSTGTLALTGNNTNALDLSAGPNVRLGAFGMASYSGVLTPNGSVYNFGTTTVNGTSQNTLNLSSALTGARSVDTSGGILNLGQQTNDTAFASLYTGGVTASGGMVRMANDPNLGAASGVVSLSNGATLQIAAFTTAGVNGQFGYLGSSVTGGGGRTINISGSGTLDIASRSLGGGAVAITAPNSITGSGTLTKSGFGQLFATRAWDGLAGGFSGTLNIAANSGQFNIIGGDGYVRNLAGVTVGQSSIFQADNNTALGQARQFVYGLALNSGTTDKIGDTIPISLQGGTLNFQARNVALGIALGGYEKVGAVTLTSGQSTISAIRVGGGGADLVLTNLAHPVGGGTVRFNSSNTIGATGDNGRITLNAVNGTAATTTAAFVGGFATIDGVNFANNALPASVGAAGGITVPTYTLPVTGATPAAALFVTGTIGNTAAASTVLGALGVGQNWPIRALKLSNGAAQTLTFAGTTGTADTIYLESGGLLTDASAFNKTIGATTNAFTRGRLTAGLTTASTPQELFLHHNAPTANPLAIHSVIINNPAGGVVSVVKDLDGLVTLSGTNTYSGGTSVLRGQLQADATGAFGTGAVTVKNARINLAAAGATSSTAGYTAIDQSEISLTGTGINYNGAGDRFNIGAGSIILGPNTNTSGVALNSLTRVSTLTAGGQIVLAPDAIVSHQKVDINVLGSGTQTIQNLGTNADLYYGLSATINNPMGVLTVGAGTPWKGISTDRNSRTFQQGSIVANSDFWLQGLVRDGGVVSLSFGVEQSTAGGNGSFSIINAAGKPINAFVAGTLVITEDSPIQMPGDLTYVLTPGALFQPNRSNSLGSPLLGGTASVIVQGGASLDPGGFVALGVNSNQNTSTLQNLPYPIPSPLNGSVTVEAGGLFQVNDASGIGSAPVGAFTMKTNSVLDLGSANAFFGRGQYALNNALAVDTTGTINPGQFVYEPGAIVRITTDNIYKISQFVGAETNGEKVVYEIAANNRIMTSQNNPFLIPVVGTPTIAPENITIGNGGMFTNDASDRVISEGRGKIVFNDGAVLAATTQTYLTIQEGIEVASGATITIGSTKFIDGMPKMGGGIQLSGPNSNVIPANATINMLDGSQIMFSGTNVWPDTRAISLPLAVAAFPSTNGSAVLPGTGNTLNLNVANFMEYVGLVTGNGAVIANQAGTALAAGYGAVADWTSNVRFINTNNPSLAKTGSTKLTLTGVSTSTGVLLAQQGEVVTSGTGTADWSETRAQRGGKITIDNTTNPLNNRLGTVGFAVGQGGNFELIGNASTAVTETFTNFATGAGGFIGQVQNGGIGVFSITPGTANTTVVVGTAENFLNAGQRVGTWLLRSPSIGNAPGTYTTAGVFVPNVGNSGNGLFQITTPNFTNQGGYGVGPGGNIANSSGSTVMPVRGDYIGDIDNVNGMGSGFLTEDTAATGMRLLAASEYGTSFRDNQSTSLNVKLSGTSSISGDTRAQTLTLTPASTLTISGTLPLGASASRLILHGGGIFVQAGSASTINAPANSFIQTNSTTSLFLHTQGDLNLNAKVFSDVAIVKTGGGTLNVGDGAFSIFRGSFLVDGGIVNLGTNNSFSNIRSATGSTSNNNLYVNNGTLNLNGNSQQISLLNSANELPGMGGTVTSTTAATITNLGGGRFAGTIGGAISLDKVGNNTLLLTNASDYTGTTQLRAGTTILRDSAALTGTTGLTIRDATLQFDNGYLSNVANRIPVTTPVNLRAGTINITGAAAQTASQTFNTLTLDGGSNTISGNAGGSGATEITIGNLVRPQGPNSTGAALNFAANYGFLGAGGSTTAVRNFITNVNGSALALNDGIVAGWAVIAGSNFATYDATRGIGALGNTADGFAAYGSTNILTATANQNVNDAATSRVLATSQTINSMRSIPTAASSYGFGNGVGVTIDTGGFIHDTNFTQSWSASAAATGQFLTSNSGELNAWVNQNAVGFNVPITGAIDLVKSGGGTLNLRPEAGALTVTNTSGTNLITSAVTAGLVVGMPVSGTGIPLGATVASITPGVSFTISQNTTAAVTTVAPLLGNTYTGKTIVNGGTLQLASGAQGTAGYRTIPGDLVIHTGATVTELNAPHQINPAANVTISSGRFNLVSLPGVTESLNSLIFLDGSGTNVALGVDRTALQATSVLNLSAATAITANNTNPTGGVPFIGGFIGSVGFTNAGGSTLMVNSPVNPNGVLAVGLRIDGAIAGVPTGVTDGGLIKDGTGLLAITTSQVASALTLTTSVGSAVLTGANTTGYQVGMPVTGAGIPAGSFITGINPNVSITISQNATAAAAVAVTGSMFNFNQTPLTYTGTTSTLTDVFNIKSGIVRMDSAVSLGANSSNTTVQSGAVLLSSLTTANTTIVGSIRLKDGSTFATDGNAVNLGNATHVVTNQSVLNIPSGTATIGLYDYFVQGTNSNNITVNGRLTGAGNINLVGQQLTQGTGGGSTLVISNPILTGSGSNDFTGTITVNANTILQNQIARPAVTSNLRDTGNALATATINLNGGRLRLRDDATAAGTAVSNATVSYGTTNVTLSADSYLDAGRVSGTDTNSGNIINLGTLTVAAGNKVLNVDSSTATTAGAGAGNYQIGFAGLAGSGNLIKGGGGRLNINTIGVGFTGGLGIAGPQGLVVAPTLNTLFLPTTSSIASFDLNGLYHSEASKTLNVSGAFNVNSNAGDIATNKSNNPGAFALTNTTTLNVGSFVNNGVVGSTGGTSTITSTGGFSGSGHYTTNGQQLNLANGGITGPVKIAGNNIVNSNALTSNLAGVQIQSGTLKLTPTAPAATSGTLIVMGSPASVASGSTAPIAAVAGVLNLDAAAGTIAHTGNITNSGLVRASAGTTTVSGTISGTTLSYTPGLVEGVLQGTATLDTSAARLANPANFGIKMEPRMGQTNVVTQNALTGWTDSQTWIYTGYVKDTDGIFSFIENIDDGVGVWVDGVHVLANGTFNVATSTAYTNGQNGTTITAGANTGTPDGDFGAGITLAGYGTGWHLLEIRFQNGSGGAGPLGANGFANNYGFGYKDGLGALDGADYIKPIDNGTGNLFVTPTGGKGNVQVDASSILRAAGITLTNNLTLASAASASTFDLTGTTASDVDNLITTGTADKANLTISNAAGVLTVNTGINLAAGTTLKKAGPGTVNFYNSAATTGAASNLELNAGTAEFANAALGTANITFTGNSTLRWKTGNTQDVSARIQSIGSGVTATLDTLANNVTLASTLSGAGNVTKIGSGILTSTAANVYTGVTNITGGTFALSGSGSIADNNLVNLTAAGTSFDISAITGPTEVIGSITSVSGSSINLGANGLDVGGDNSNFSNAGDISGTGGSLTKSGTGTATISGNNTYTGSTNLNAGTLLLGANNTLPDTAALNLSSGTTLNTGGFSDTTGALSLNTAATIDLSTGSTSVLTFANTSTWTGILSIWNYTGGSIWTASTGDKISFTANSLSSINLDSIQFYSDNGITPIGTGAGFFGGGTELVPVPETSTSVAALLLLSTLGFRERRRFFHYRK